MTASATGKGGAGKQTGKWSSGSIVFPGNQTPKGSLPAGRIDFLDWC